MALPTDIVSINQVAAALDWSSAQQVEHGDEMAMFISAVTPVVEEIIGPVIGQSFDEWYSGGGEDIVLRRRPILSIDSITETTGASSATLTEAAPGTPADSHGYSVDLTLGIVTRRSNGTATSFAPGDRNIHITYTAGRAATPDGVPANITLGTLELIRFHWQPQQAGNQPGFGMSAATGYDTMSDGIRVLGYFVPNRVVALLRPGSKKVGFA